MGAKSSKEQDCRKVRQDTGRAEGKVPVRLGDAVLEVRVDDLLDDAVQFLGQQLDVVARVLRVVLPQVDDDVFQAGPAR
jgi:hypothetical protein